jgi:hypothetical protein
VSTWLRARHGERVRRRRRPAEARPKRHPAATAGRPAAHNGAMSMADAHRTLPGRTLDRRALGHPLGRGRLVQGF